MGITINRANKNFNGNLRGDLTNFAANTLYLGLSIAPINNDGTGIKEPNIGVGGYQRVALSISKTGAFSLASNGQISNAAEIKFNEFTGDLSVTGATGDLNATHWFLTTDATSTESSIVEWFGELKRKRPLIAESTISFNAGDIVIEYVMPV